MKINYWITFYLIITFFSCQSTKVLKTTYIHPIVYKPATYICYQTDQSIKIDGKLNEGIWKETPVTNDFQDIEGNLKPRPSFQTNVKMLWDSDYLYFGAYLEEPDIWGKLTERDAVIFYDNDFEIFIDPDGDSHNYYEFEINALNTVWDLLLLRPYRDGRMPKVLNSWDIQGIQTAVNIEGTINNSNDIDSCWTIEIAIPWKVLNEMTPKDFRPKEGIQWRVNFSRVNWEMEVVEGQYVKKKDLDNRNLPEKNWVWSPQGYIAMHAPETWGYVQFSEKIAGQGNSEFIDFPDEKIKWALRKLYYEQRLFYKKNKKYADRLQQLNLPKIMIEGYNFEPKIYVYPSGYEIIAPSTNGKNNWIIKENGQILLYKK